MPVRDKEGSMRYAIILPVVGLVMVALAGCGEQQGGGGDSAPADTPAPAVEEPADPAPQE